MPALPTVDVNLFVHNGAATVGAAIESMRGADLARISLTLIDDGSTDGTRAAGLDYAAQDRGDPTQSINRRNGGAVANFQRGFWFGDADFVHAEIGRRRDRAGLHRRTLMEVLLANPDCAMCHAAGLVFRETQESNVTIRPSTACTRSVPIRCARTRYVMARYTSSPVFWGIYRRAAVDTHCRRSVRAPAGTTSCWRSWRWRERSAMCRRCCIGGVTAASRCSHLARAATEQARAGLSPAMNLAEQRWRTPLITTA